MRQATRKRMNIHLLHLEAVELFLDLLGEQRGEAIARRRLGARFDISAFNDAGLLSGIMQLGVLEQRIEDWIGTQAI